MRPTSLPGGDRQGQVVHRVPTRLGGLALLQQQDDALRAREQLGEELPVATGATFRKKTELAREMFDLVVAWLAPPEGRAARCILLAIDSGYANATVLRDLPRSVEVVGAMRPDAALALAKGVATLSPETLAADEAVPWERVRAKGARHAADRACPGGHRPVGRSDDEVALDRALVPEGSHGERPLARLRLVLVELDLDQHPRRLVSGLQQEVETDLRGVDDTAGRVRRSQVAWESPLVDHPDEHPQPLGMVAQQDNQGLVRSAWHGEEIRAAVGRRQPSGRVDGRPT